ELDAVEDARIEGQVVLLARSRRIEHADPVGIAPALGAQEHAARGGPTRPGPRQSPTRSPAAKNSGSSAPPVAWRNASAQCRRAPGVNRRSRRNAPTSGLAT